MRGTQVPLSESREGGSDSGGEASKNSEGDGEAENIAQSNTNPNQEAKEEMCELGQKGTFAPRLRNDPTATPSPFSSSLSSSTTGEDIGGVARPIAFGGVLEGVKKKKETETKNSDGSVVSKWNEYASRAFGFATASRWGGRKSEGAGTGVNNDKKEVLEHQMKVMFKELPPMPFELAMLEAMLQEVREMSGIYIYIYVDMCKPDSRRDSLECTVWHTINTTVGVVRCGPKFLLRVIHCFSRSWSMILWLSKNVDEGSPSFNIHRSINTLDFFFIRCFCFILSVPF